MLHENFTLLCGKTGYSECMEQYQQEREAGDRHVQNMLEAGIWTRPEADNPAHQRIATIVQDLAAEHGLTPELYLVKADGCTEELVALNQRKTLSQFGSIVFNQALIVPESADYFLTDDELRAVVLHEFGHMHHPEQTAERAEAGTAYTKAFSGMFREGSAAQKQEWAAERDAAFERLQRLVDENERQADAYMVAHGHGSDAIAGLQKMQILSHAHEDEGLLPPEEILQKCDAASRKLHCRPDEGKRPHLSESFLERIQRIERETEAQESRGR